MKKRQLYFKGEKNMAKKKKMVKKKIENKKRKPLAYKVKNHALPIEARQRKKRRRVTKEKEEDLFETESFAQEELSNVQDINDDYYEDNYDGDHF
jgi:hypothetical protein